MQQFSENYRFVIQYFIGNLIIINIKIKQYS